MKVKKRTIEKSKRFTGGFTLVELLIVMAVISVLLAIASPSIMEWRKNLQYKQAADGIQSAMRTTKSNALALNMQNRLECNPAGSRYRITQGNRAYNSDTWTTVKQDWVTVPDGVVVKTGDCTSNDDLNIAFSPNGTATANDSAVTGTICINEGTANKYQIIVNASGRIRNVKP